MSDHFDTDEADDGMDCPLCLDPLDLTERSFKPCPCNYQMCTFCFHRIIDQEGNKCPACRRTYNPDNYVHVPINPLDHQKSKSKTQSKGQKPGVDIRKSLTNIRVVQRNLVYVTNLSLDLAKEEILRKPEYFGQYGKIVKMVVNRSHVYQGSSVSCYVTYHKPEEAYRCIETVDGCILNDRTLRASFGTTKYCSYFLRNRTCTNPDCMYLHELGDEKDSFTKEDMQEGKHLARVPPPAPVHQVSRTNGLPPPRNPLRASVSSVTPSSTSIASKSSANPSHPIAQAQVSTNAWKTQSLGPSISSAESRKNDMGETTSRQKLARNTQTMMEQYSDDEEDGIRADSVASSQSIAVDDSEFPALGSSVSLTQSSNLSKSSHIANPASLKSSTTIANNAPSYVSLLSSSNSTTAPSIVSNNSTASNNVTSPSLNVFDEEEFPPVHVTASTNASNSNTSNSNNPNHSHSHSHSKSHWHPKEASKPVWQPKAILKPAAESNSLLTPSLSSSLQPDQVSSRADLTTSDASFKIKALQAPSNTTDQDAKEPSRPAADVPSSGSKSPWKVTPVPAVSIHSELQRLEQESKSATTKPSLPVSPPSSTASKSVLPPTVSWASKSDSSNKTDDFVHSEMVSLDSLTSHEPTTPSKAQQQKQKSISSSQKKNKQAASKIIPFAPPKEPVFDVPATKTETSVEQESESKKSVAEPEKSHVEPSIPEVASPLSTGESTPPSDDTFSQLMPSYLLSALSGLGIQPGKAVEQEAATVPPTYTSRLGDLSTADSEPVIPLSNSASTIGSRKPAQPAINPLPVAEPAPVESNTNFLPPFSSFGAEAEPWLLTGLFPQPQTTTQTSQTEAGLWSFNEAGFGTTNLFGAFQAPQTAPKQPVAALPGGFGEEPMQHTDNHRPRYGFGQESSSDSQIGFNSPNIIGSTVPRPVGQSSLHTPPGHREAPPGLFPPISSPPGINPIGAQSSHNYPSNTANNSADRLSSLRALLPNVNINFNTAPPAQPSANPEQLPTAQVQGLSPQQLQQQLMQQHQQLMQYQKPQGGQGWNSLMPFGQVNPTPQHVSSSGGWPQQKKSNYSSAHRGYSQNEMWFPPGLNSSAGTTLDWSQPQMAQQPQPHIPQSTGVQQGQSILSALSGGSPKVSSTNPPNIQSGARYGQQQVWGVPSQQQYMVYDHNFAAQQPTQGQAPHGFSE